MASKTPRCIILRKPWTPSAPTKSVPTSSQPTTQSTTQSSTQPLTLEEIDTETTSTQQNNQNNRKDKTKNTRNNTINNENEGEEEAETNDENITILLEGWDDENNDKNRDKRFQNLVIRSLLDIDRRMKNIEELMGESDEKMQTMNAGMEKLEVKHIKDKAAENENVTYFKTETRKVLRNWFNNRKFPFEVQPLEVATEAKKNCKVIDPENLSKNGIFISYIASSQKDFRHQFNTEVLGSLKDKFPAFQELSTELANFVGKGRRVKGETLKVHTQAERHAMRNRIWGVFQLKKGPKVKDHALSLFKQIKDKLSDELTESDEDLARVLIEFILRCKRMENVEERYKAIRNIGGISEDDINQHIFEYSESEEEDANKENVPEEEPVQQDQPESSSASEKRKRGSNNNGKEKEKASGNRKGKSKASRTNTKATASAQSNSGTDSE